ncbi:hypothetical protein [Acetobacter persici]|uniref:hypothetical protein n=1 Tax=Acetobacter persici TaxID=1076596 RepID=UPI0039ECC99D
MKKTEALAALDAATAAMRNHIKKASAQDDIAVALCAVIKPSNQTDAIVACGTGGTGATVAFAISCIIKDAITRLPQRLHKKFLSTIEFLQHEARLKSLVQSDQGEVEQCPSTTLH